MTVVAALAAVVPGLEPNVTSADAGFHAAFASAGRRFGTAPIGAAQHAAIVTAGLLVPADLGADECARGALLLEVAGHLDADARFALARDLLRRGELRERQAVLRVLAALPEPERYVELAIDACRTNVAGVFRAIACDNAYPAAHFDDPAFAQLVLKALFTGAPLARVHGLEARTTGELVRMVEAYASERRSAGRPIPDDVELVPPGGDREAVRSAHPHDVADDRRLPGDGRGRHRGRRRARVLARPAAHPRRHASRTTSCRSLGWERFRAGQFGIRHYCTIGLNPQGGQRPGAGRRRARDAAALPREGRRGRGRRDRLRRPDRRRGPLFRRAARARPGPPSCRR